MNQQLRSLTSLSNDPVLISRAHVESQEPM